VADKVQCCFAATDAADGGGGIGDTNNGSCLKWWKLVPKIDYFYLI